MMTGTMKFDKGECVICYKMGARSHGKKVKMQLSKQKKNTREWNNLPGNSVNTRHTATEKKVKR